LLVRFDNGTWQKNRITELRGFGNSPQPCAASSKEYDLQFFDAAFFET
jgi:hypothetical protein